TVGVVHLALEGPSRQVAAETSVEVIEQPRRVLVGLLLERGVVGERCGHLVAQLQAGRGEHLHALIQLRRQAVLEGWRDSLPQLEIHRVLRTRRECSPGARLITEWIVAGRVSAKRQRTRQNHARAALQEPGRARPAPAGLGRRSEKGSGAEIW